MTRERVSSDFVVDQRFSSFDEWSAWSAANPFVYDGEHARSIGERIAATGFEEPMFGTLVAPEEIQCQGNNWREGLYARGLNSRQRAVLETLNRLVADRHPSLIRIFAAEAVTELALRLRGRHARFYGAEYTPSDEARDELFPIPHQDLTALDLPSGRFDIVTTNEVLEHVPDLDAALREIARVLATKGWHIGTHPFRLGSASGDVRAFLKDGQVVHLKEPEIHGNPVDPSGGSLVFETPGWDILERAKKAGFTRAHMRFVASERFGILTENTGVFVLCAQK